MAFAAAFLVATSIIAIPSLRLAAADEDMPSMISNAKTGADHEALAKMYEDEADKAKAQATEHKKMAEAYGRTPRLSELKGHCERLASYYKSAAKEFRLLATLEREKAKAPEEQPTP